MHCKNVTRNTANYRCITTVPRYCTVFRVIFAGILFQCVFKLQESCLNIKNILVSEYNFNRSLRIFVATKFHEYLFLHEYILKTIWDLRTFNDVNILGGGQTSKWLVAKNYTFCRLCISIALT